MDDTYRDAKIAQKLIICNILLIKYLLPEFVNQIQEFYKGYKECVYKTIRLLRILKLFASSILVMYNLSLSSLPKEC